MEHKKHIDKIIEVITKNEIKFFKDIFNHYTNISRPTAYNYNLDKIDDIKEALYKNRRKAVTSMIDKWIKSDNATLQIAAMRILSDQDERQALNQQYIEHSGKVEPITLVFKEKDNGD